MRSLRLLSLMLATLLATTAATKDSTGFEYPKLMPSPPMLWVEGFASRMHAAGIQEYETPIQVYQTWRIDQLMWNCIAMYHPTALDALSKDRPQYVAPSKHHNSKARALCMMHALNNVIDDLIPVSAKLIHDWVAEVGLDASKMDTNKAMAAAKKGNSSPRVFGTIVGAGLLADMKVDGWNYDGALNNNGKCTRNCRPFSDYTGYSPENTPWELKNKRSWQPLIESDGKGFYYAQEHVTPHIGTQAKPVVLTRKEIDARKLADPEYNYNKETRKAIKRVSKLTGEDKKTIEFFDNKINIAGGMIMRIRAAFGLSLEAQVFYHYGYTSSELDVVILAWKEKVRHSLVRPTSLVHALGEKKVKSWGNPEKHAAYDWHPYIRVMPHSEYPSGSGCICIAIAQYIDEFMKQEYNQESFATEWNFAAGSVNTEPGLPEKPLTLKYDTMTELYKACGKSRLTGGMHFTASVPDSYELCDGVGKLGYSRLMKGLLGKGTYSQLMDPKSNMLFEG